MLYYAHLASAAFTAASLILLLPFSHAQAANLFTGNGSGTFGTPLIDPDIDPDAAFSTENPREGSETFVLGEPGPGSMPNKLAFQGLPFESSANQAFKIGSLSYFNGQTFQGTNVSSVPFNISLNFTQPTESEQPFSYQFRFDLTPNEGESSEDRLSISNNPAPQILDTQEASYRIELLGFSPDDGNSFTQSFQAPEDEVISSTLFAQIKLATIKQDTEPFLPVDIPEPAMLPGLLLLSGTLLRKKQTIA
ncbi:MAG: choice-of-anchor K domain-containing protein [Cyanobacteria bacterium J06634_5]